jgi:hypothetical protein
MFFLKMVLIRNNNLKLTWAIAVEKSKQNEKNS